MFKEHKCCAVSTQHVRLLVHTLSHKIRHAALMPCLTHLSGEMSKINWKMCEACLQWEMGGRGLVYTEHSAGDIEVNGYWSEGYFSEAEF